MTTSEFITWLTGYLEARSVDPTINSDILRIQNKLITTKETLQNSTHSPFFSYTNSTVSLNSRPKVLLTEQDEKII